MRQTTAMQDSDDLAQVFIPVDTTGQLVAARQLADSIAATLRMARALVEARRRVDLDGLNGMIGLLCARALDLPPEQGRSFRARLIALRTDLDDLSVALKPP
ncbi:hypothetical protein [Limobrevibacterium gyesilva]|uniref:Uncharacterized protein n=1 Tax=Limobrevibacterium gyesilva TaxID=2991712 RepID=A0AA41YJY0_9PROT|nr:hypothetical protein [Limobrevibacterium gyesilva]MCW3475101.1 hypothetical protein [Limobrevibacterium gyesilva]